MCELRAHYSLALLTVSYLVGEMGHFMLGATSRAMARELEYGDEACLCDDQLEQEECLETRSPARDPSFERRLPSPLAEAA